MPQDIRELMKQDRQLPRDIIKEGHGQRFLDRLDKELPQKTRSYRYSWLKIAASIVIVFSVSFMAMHQLDGDTLETKIVQQEQMNVKDAKMVLEKQSSSLAEISPEYKEYENTILTSIKFQLSQITIDDTNRDLVESFLVRLSKLDKEYHRLNKELIAVGPNIDNVEAMMENLTLRLTLMNRLKDKLIELKRIEKEDYNELQA